MGTLVMRLGLALIAPFLLWTAAFPAHAEESAGELRCMVAGGIGFSVFGKRATSCVYYRRDGRIEFYIGSFGRFGLDIGPASARQVDFMVRAPQPEPIGALGGDYVGPGVGATIGTGLEGDGLIGGRNQAVTIVPMANSRSTGLNVNAGVGDLHLKYAGTESRRERYSY